MYCDKCYKMIDDDASVCPWCGKAVKSGGLKGTGNTKITKKWWFWVLVVFALGIFARFTNAITPPDKTEFIIMAEDIIEDCLKSPSTAKFCSPHECIVYGNGDIGYVRGYVDSQNGFGAVVRGEYAVQFRVINKNSFTAEPIYIKFNDDILYGAYLNTDLKYMK